MSCYKTWTNLKKQKQSAKLGNTIHFEYGKTCISPSATQTENITAMSHNQSDHMTVPEIFFIPCSNQSWEITLIPNTNIDYIGELHVSTV